ncbi:Ig-like domain-containing protein, partial [Roseomonas sp. GC11]|uniref:Ig-like domain-containing protein n=1 Tax=Roseomonas sp. GC11 TaxID=2950546 RepID=UPI002109B174
SVTIDTAAPAAPTGLAFATDSATTGDGLTNDTTPTLSGTAEANATIAILRDGVQIDTTTADGAGAWSWTEASALADGSYSYTATATDTAGNVSVSSSALSVTVDATAPTIASVTLPANATYKIGDTLELRLTFSESVLLAGGTPQLALDIGGTTRQALYTSGAGTTELVFQYTVQSGDLDADGIALGSLALSGATLRDAAGNDATLTLPATGSTAGILVDGVAPTISSVAVPADDTYGVGETL